MTDSEIIVKLINLLGLKNGNQLAKTLGFKADRVYNVIKGRNGLSTRFIDRIIDVYPQINRKWIEIGTGEPFVESFNTISDRVGKIIDYLGYNFLEFTKSINLSDVEKFKLSEAINKSLVPDKKVIEKILDRYPEISREWLIDNKGTMLTIKDELLPDQEQKLKLLQDLVRSKDDQILTKNSYINKLEEENEMLENMLNELMEQYKIVRQFSKIEKRLEEKMRNTDEKLTRFRVKK